MKLIKKLIILNCNIKVIIFSFAIFFLSSNYVLSQEEGLDSYLGVDTDYCSLYFQGNVDFKKIDRNINIKFLNISSVDRDLINQTEDLAKRIALKCDILVLKSEQILDMYPADFHVNIIFFENTERMLDEYERLLGVREDLYSFYIYENNTIYTTQERINQNVLAHEIGHALVNHYFIIRPPRTVREIISQYIDLHLED